MEAKVEGGSAFAPIQMVLEPGEAVEAESDAMAGMEMKASLKGRFLSALARRLFGRESRFISRFTRSGCV